MKHILIVKDDFSCFYQDHPNGSQLCPKLGPRMIELKEHAGQIISSLKFGKCTAVFGERENLSFTIISDLNEGEQYLKTQILFIQQLLEVKYGSNIFNGTERIQTRKLTSLFNNTKKLFGSEQSFLLGATEYADIKSYKEKIASVVKNVKFFHFFYIKFIDFYQN